MASIFYIILLIAVILFLGKTTITLAPFAIHMAAWRTVIGYLLIFFGVAFIYSDIRHDIRMELLNELETEFKELKTSKENLINVSTNNDSIQANAVESIEK